jgi:hypothetical protein
VSRFVSAGGGFLLAVLWFDLMFDVQVIRHRDREPPEAVLASISAYYARVTTAARPMNRLIAAVMLATLAAILVELIEAGSPTWVAAASLALAAAAIGLAAMRTVPSAVRLGARRDSARRQGELARSILGEHLFCAAAIALLLVLQLGFA